MIVAGVVLMMMSLLLVLLLARTAEIEAVRFQRLTAMVVLGVTVIAAVLFTAGIAVTGVAVLQTL